MLNYAKRITFIAIMVISPLATSQEPNFGRSNCTIIYSLNGLANEYFNIEVDQLSQQITRQAVVLIDLNHWQKDTPHINLSGRTRNLLRQKYQLPNDINQAVAISSDGIIIKRYSGSLTLVNVLLDCQK